MVCVFRVRSKVMGCDPIVVITTAAGSNPVVHPNNLLSNSYMVNVDNGKSVALWMRTRCQFESDHSPKILL